MSVFRMINQKLQTLFVFDGEALDPFVIDRDHRGERHYLDIHQFLHQGIIPKVDTIEMCPPLEMRANYMLKDNHGKDVPLEVNMDISHKKSGNHSGWEFMLELTTDSLEKPTVGNGLGSKDYILGLDAVKKKALPKFLTEDAIAKLGVSNEI